MALRKKSSTRLINCDDDSLERIMLVIKICAIVLLLLNGVDFYFSWCHSENQQLSQPMSINNHHHHHDHHYCNYIDNYYYHHHPHHKEMMMKESIQ